MKLLQTATMTLALLMLHVSLFAQATIEKTIDQRGEAVISIAASDLGKIENLENYSLDHDPIRNKRAFFYVNKKHYQDFQNLGIQMQAEAIPSFIHEAKMASSAKEAKEWDTYPTYDAYVEMMLQFAEDYPELCLVDTIGYSVENRLILVLKISDNVTTNDLDEPDFFYTATMHGDETVGYVLMLRLVDYMLSNYNSDDRIKNMIDNLEIYINPLSNPDGTFAGGNYSVNGATRYNSNGVDLNRNFPDAVGGQHPDGNSWQQENIVMMDFMEAHNFVSSMNFHGGAEVMNYPWDHKYDLHPDDEWFIYVSREYADTVHDVDNSYMADFDDGITNGAAWYRVEGGRQDYTTHFLHGREITAELSNVKLPSASELPDFWDKNYRSLLNFIEQTLYGVKGVVTNIYGTPLHAKIFIDGHDDDSSHVWTNETGVYLRLLEEGTHNITYMAEGYESQTISVTVNNRSRTIQNVALEVYVPPIEVSISHNATNPTNQSPIQLSVEFSADITGFEASDLTITNGSADNLQVVADNRSFTLDLTPNNSGMVMVKIEEDVVDEGNELSNNLIFVYDIDAPKNSSAIINNITNNSFDASLTFDESGTLYYGGWESEENTPSTDDLINGSENFVFSGTHEISADEAVNFTITGLAASQGYSLFFIAADALGNISDLYTERITTTTIQDALAKHLNIYPNPAKEVLYIASEEIISNVSLIALDGKVHAIEATKKIANNLHSINLNDFNPGVYFITGNCGDQIFREKVIIQ